MSGDCSHAAAVVVLKVVLDSRLWVNLDLILKEKEI